MKAQHRGVLNTASIAPIRTEADHRAALARIDALMDAEAGTPEADELSVLANLVEFYETERFPIKRPTPLRALRWGDTDRYFGPFTWSYNNDSPHLAVVLKSRGDDDSGDKSCSLRISLHKATLIIALPDLVRPHRSKVYPKSWDAETIKRLGRNWYWDIDPRKYGFSLNNGYLSVYYGRTGGACADSNIQRQWGCFLPWTQWRIVRHSLYGLAGEHVYTEPDGGDWTAYNAAKNACPTVKFTIEDYDGEKIVAATMIEEREWHFGTGWFKWLSWFCRPKICRSLDIRFSSETGPEKGSWKGGIIGTGIDMRPGEDHESAFRRYCNEQHRSKYQNYNVKFLSRQSRA